MNEVDDRNFNEHPRESCGIFGICGHPDAAKLTYYGLYALQHRGQESAGIATATGENILSHKGMGLVPDVFDDRHFRELNGKCAIGHVRYSTTGSSVFLNAQPIVIRYGNKSLAMAHNGNIVNALELKKELEESGSIFQTTMDSEVFLHFFVKNLKYGFEEALIRSTERLRGAFSMLLLTGDGKIVGIKDPDGFRPLCLGLLDGKHVLASESCALDLVKADLVRECGPGEIVMVDKNGLKIIKPGKRRSKNFCIFEFIYFARPDSNIFGKSVYEMRKAFGRRLAVEAPADADLVMPFPDSGNYAALGFAEESGTPFEIGMIRNHYVGRTFIQPSQNMRDFGARVKLNPVKEILEGKEIVIVEDSIIRGTTAKARVTTLRAMGVKKIHFRVSSPPHRFPCHYGIDFPTKKELIAAKYSVEKLRDHLGLDSLHYLSVEGLLDSTGIRKPEDEFCKACFDGDYPVSFNDDISKDCME